MVYVILFQVFDDFGVVVFCQIVVVGVVGMQVWFYVFLDEEVVVDWLWQFVEQFEIWCIWYVVVYLGQVGIWIGQWLQYLFGVFYYLGSFWVVCVFVVQVQCGVVGQLVEGGVDGVVVGYWQFVWVQWGEVFLGVDIEVGDFVGMIYGSFCLMGWG